MTRDMARRQALDDPLVSRRQFRHRERAAGSATRHVGQFPQPFGITAHPEPDGECRPPVLPVSPGAVSREPAAHCPAAPSPERLPRAAARVERRYHRPRGGCFPAVSSFCSTPPVESEIPAKRWGDGIPTDSATGRAQTPATEAQRHVDGQRTVGGRPLRARGSCAGAQANDADAGVSRSSRKQLSHAASRSSVVSCRTWPLYSASASAWLIRSRG